jgi:hypothetical protein
VKRIAVLAGVAALATACSGSHGKTLGGRGVSLTLHPKGWYGVSGPGQLQAADFPLACSVLASAERAHVRRGHVHVIVWDYGPKVIVRPVSAHFARRVFSTNGRSFDVSAVYSSPGGLEQANRLISGLRLGTTKR